jgi:hypothetical protein
VSIESDAQKDLSLASDDAESVTGGRMMRLIKKQKRAHKTATHHAAATQSPGLPTTYTDEPAVDPVADEEGT